MEHVLPATQEKESIMEVALPVPQVNFLMEPLLAKTAAEYARPAMSTMETA